VEVKVGKDRERTIGLRWVRGRLVKPDFAQFTSIPVFTAGKLAVEGTQPLLLMHLYYYYFNHYHCHRLRLPAMTRKLIPDYWA
jgi:hypothetical protein